MMKAERKRFTWRSDSDSDSELSSWLGIRRGRCPSALDILKSTEVVLRRACSSATVPEYEAKSHGD